MNNGRQLFLGVVLGLLVLASHAKTTWQQLTPAQQQALQPLAGVWPSLEEPRQRKWIEFTRRYERMSPNERARAQERMKAWASLTPEQRRTARENFREAKRVPAEERQKKWQAYQQLPENEKKQLAEQARERRRPGVAKPPHANTLRPMPAPANHRAQAPVDPQ